MPRQCCRCACFVDRGSVCERGDAEGSGELKEGERDVFKRTGGNFGIGGGMGISSKLNEILEVQFVKFPIRGRWSLGGYVGELRVIKMNGHRCRWISFDGSVYYGHIVWITNEHIIDLSTDLLMKELRQHGVQCFKERNWCS